MMGNRLQVLSAEYFEMKVFSLTFCVLPQHGAKGQQPYCSRLFSL